MISEAGPVAGAVVRLGAVVGHLRTWPVAVILTDEVGRFDFGIQPALAYRVGAQRDGLSPAVALVDLRRARAADEVELRLLPCAVRLHGTVRDASGGVVAGAAVRLRAAEVATVTDDRGAYGLCVSPGAMDDVEVSAAGYGVEVEDGAAAARAARPGRHGGPPLPAR